MACGAGSARDIWWWVGGATAGAGSRQRGAPRLGVCFARESALRSYAWLNTPPRTLRYPIYTTLS